ncbi:MAG: hypothetical protein BWK79_14090, partial [Beggiatoa sp. IS2]
SGVYFAEQPEPRSLTLSWIPNTEPAQFSALPSTDPTTSSESSSEAVSRQPFDSSAFNPLSHAGKKESVAPGQAKKIRYGEVELEVG